MFNSLHLEGKELLAIACPLALWGAVRIQHPLCSTWLQLLLPGDMEEVALEFSQLPSQQLSVLLIPVLSACRTGRWELSSVLAAVAAGILGDATCTRLWYWCLHKQLLFPCRHPGGQPYPWQKHQPGPVSQRTPSPSSCGDGRTGTLQLPISAGVSVVRTLLTSSGNGWALPCSPSMQRPSQK